MIQNCDECGASDSEYYIDGSCISCAGERCRRETILKSAIQNAIELMDEEPAKELLEQALKLKDE